MKWIDAGGVALRYALSGAGDDIVVFLHEAGGSMESWDRVVPRLESGFRTLRYDQRGFGHSEKTTQLSLQGMVGDLMALIDALGIDRRCHLVGTAIGGSIALACAAWHPDRVASVTSTSPVTGPLTDAARSSLDQRAATVAVEGMRAIADTSLQRSYPQELRDDAEWFAQYRNRYLANDPQSFAALTRAFGSIDLSGLYPLIACPVLLVGCKRDSLKPAGECAVTATRILHGRFVEVDSGHFVAVQSAELFTDVLMDFLKEHRAAP